MGPDERIHVPVGTAAGRWRTFAGERLVVVAARTVTSLVRVLDVVPEVLRDDARVTVVFAYDPTSAFNDGVLDLLRSQGCRTMPWPQLAECAPDLVISASENLTLPPGDYPVLVLPHGIGFQKQVPDSAGPGTRLSGMVPDALLETRRAWLAVSHPGQDAQLAASHPATVGRTLMVGDPCYDRLLASGRWRERYRSALGVLPGQRLVVITSTWGSESLAGRHPGLPAELLAQLPVDEYRVALILHPNVWSGHGAWQIGVLQRTAVEAGLTTVDPADGWQQALTAADLVIGDHGSVTVYAAAIGRPVLLAAFGPEAVPNTAGWALRTVAPWLDTARPLAAQIETALTDHRPDRYEPVTAEAFGVRGQALPRLRETVYDLLDLAQPKQPARTARAFGLPAPGAAPPRSLIVGTTLTGRQDQAFEVDLQRFPAVLAGEPVEREDSFQHLACDVDEPDTRLTESATVLLVRSCVFASDDGRRRTIELLADFPGARLAAVSSENGCLVGLRDGTTLEVSSPARPCPDPGAAAAAVYTCLRLGVAPHGITVTLRSGTSAQELSLRALGPAGADQSPASRARTSTARGLPASS